jgi:hypothetical protein
MVALASASLREAGVRRPREHLLLVRSRTGADPRYREAIGVGTLLVAREPFSSDDLTAARTAAARLRFDIVLDPVAASDPTLEALADAETFAGAVAASPLDISPPTDDRPFFFHFFKWEQTPDVLRLLGKTWQPFGGAGYLIVLALLLLVSALALALVAVPIGVVLRRGARGGWLSPTIYFGGLGFGFLLVEIALVQRFILLLEQPAYSLAVVLFGLLVFSGLGSAISGGLPWRGALAALVAAIVVYPSLLSETFPTLLGERLAVRVLVALVLLAPLGLLMGVPFPRGLRALGRTGPDWLPLAWGVNGFTSVIGAVLAAVIALSFGFDSVFLAGALAYLAALAAVRSLNLSGA